ncbi:hypothetical protein CHS0354_041674 [Potamilus streckersoni]|uniref:Uncharacterized protein n=1 Tax=Potamilus streckersoni TaxID=2493646 RepID=A0AAE0SDA2_9BIVA|nr:hypothetical protein CHS0354_041674 [Potamilus streckersoni]
MLVSLIPIVDKLCDVPRVGWVFDFVTGRGRICHEVESTGISKQILVFPVEEILQTTMRYILFFSYVGTRYSGLQIQKGAQMKNVQTIQGVLESLLHRLFFPNKVVMKTCSRTDTGVHALMNTASFDPQPYEHNNRTYEPNQIKTGIITKSLNSQLAKANHQIRIWKTCRVTDDFIARKKVASRSYVYRICLKHGNQLVAGPSPFELQRVLVIMQPFDFDKFLETAELLSGTHDFANFMMQKGLKQAINTVLTVSINIKRGSSVIEEYQNLSKNQLEFWEIHFSSKGFLWRQAFPLGLDISPGSSLI